MTWSDTQGFLEDGSPWSTEGWPEEQGRVEEGGCGVNAGRGDGDFHQRGYLGADLTWT